MVTRRRRGHKFSSSRCKIFRGGVLLGKGGGEVLMTRAGLVSNADLDAWVLSTAPDAVAYAASLLRDRAAAEDVVQDCYCRLLQKANVYDLPRDGRKLLFESVTNACINRATRARHVLSLDAADEDDASLHEVVADADAAPPD